MPADLGFVAHAAERDADELALHGARDRLAERGLADAGRADEAQDRPFHVAFELPHREVFDDALFDLVEIVVILVEDAARLDRVDAILGDRQPGQLEHPVDVGADHLGLGRRRSHARQAIDLAVDDLPHVIGQARRPRRARAAP